MHRLYRMSNTSLIIIVSILLLLFLLFGLAACTVSPNYIRRKHAAQKGLQQIMVNISMNISEVNHDLFMPIGSVSEVFTSEDGQCIYATTYQIYGTQLDYEMAASKFGELLRSKGWREGDQYVYFLGERARLVLQPSLGPFVESKLLEQGIDIEKENERYVSLLNVDIMYAMPTMEDCQ